ncbi:MAG: alpha-N-acetylglucosaminidase, partial [Bacteroidaceae bacterium]|nr:alpha-N-acetylglucosaminidase [Bacteroidaceae bacterium]
TVAVKENGAAYADLSNLPLPSQTETHTSDAKYRYYLNTCTFGYSMTSWTWTRWQQEIDWMALHGINMPLQLVGLEEVWRTFLIKCGYSETDAKAFVAGPAFIAWWAMNNLQGWGGTDPGTKSGGTWAGAGGVQDDAWYARQTKLAKQIVEAQRGLGMQPVLPGWSGMVPTNFASKSTGKYATRGNGGNWAGDFVRPLLLNTNIGADKYAEIAADYYECLHAVMGESQYYSMDPFHEGGGAGTMEDYEALYAAMEAAKPGSQWVIQQWQWSATQKYSLTAVPEGRLIVLDLFSDGSPAFDGYNGYAPQEAVFCAIPNFGGRSGLMGRLQNVTDNYFKFKGKYASIKGIGTAPEAIEQTPVAYDLIYQLPWMNGEKPSVEEWVNNYSIARYGKDNEVVKEAWSLLRQGPLNYGADGIQGPVEDVWAVRPNLNANAASYWGKTLNNGTASNTYTKERRQMLIDAVYKLIDQEDELALEDGSVYESNYLYDLVEFGGAVMADYAYDLLLGIRDAKNAANTALYEARRDAFLQLILDMDAFRGTNLNFRLGKWTQEARAAAAEVEGATTATPDWYEYNNARTILSTWSSPNTNLTDYSYRSWQGLLKDYYYPRWKHYFDNNCTGAEYGYFEWNWAHGMKHEVGQTAVSNVPLAPGEAGHTDSYTREPEGNTVEKAVEMLRKYIVPIHMNDGSIYYAYRTFTYDLTDKVTVNVAADATVDFTHNFDIPGDATITGDFINNVEKSAPVNAVPVKPEEAVYTATITLADGTKLENFTVHTPSFNGVYKVSLVTDWGNTPVFIQYNENDNVAGYKMVATSNGYSTDSELDKWFSIAHSGDGYTISAQGKYLKTPLVWEYVLFSENAEEAGTYLFDDSDTHDIYKIVNVDGYHLQAWSSVMALEPGNNTPSTFAFEKVEAYPITIPTDSFTTVYLPFNVLLPAGVEAYDVCGNELVNDSKDHAQGALEKIANSGDVLKAGTPAVLKGAPGSHELEIVMSSNKAKAGLPYSALRGSYEKHTLVHTDDIKKFVLHGTHFDDLQTYYTTVLKNQEGEAVVEMAANTCWLEANIETNQIGLNEGSFVKIEDWLFQYEAATNGIKLTNAAVSGDGELVIPSEVTINGEPKNVVAVSPDFLHGNTELTSITLPATLVNLGFREVVPMFEASYEGQKGDGATYEEGTTTVLTQQGMNRCCVFPVDPDTGKPFVISKDFAWKLTLDVTIDADNLSYNKWGSAIVSTKENSLDDHYNGYMQIYMWKDLQHIVVKIDNADDRYSYSTQALDENGDVIKKDDGSDSLLVNRHFRFELEHDGTGGYQVVIYYDNGKAKMYSISASENNKVGDFDRLYYSLPEGIHVNVKFDKLISQGLFVGCTNLHEIIVDENNPTFKSCEHGVLYDKNGFYVMRIPEGEQYHHFDIPSKVVKLYPGSIHGVTADIVLHSNPQIGVVEGHEEHVENAKFYLSLDDVDPDPTVGGARDFISANLNHYQKARYKRAPLEEGKYGTIMLPFAPTNAMDKYDFFKLTDADATSLHFSPVDEIEAQTPYLYKLKENPGEMLMEDGKDVFETTEEFTVMYYDKYDPTQEELGSFRALGAYVNHYIETVNYPKSSYYYYSISQAKFLKVTNKLTYRPYRVLFVVTPEEGQAAQAPARLNLRIRKSDGTSTEIDPSQIEGWEEDVYYDLQGRRVENPTQGIYIVNARKVVIE